MSCEHWCTFLLYDFSSCPSAWQKKAYFVSHTWNESWCNLWDNQERKSSVSMCTSLGSISARAKVYPPSSWTLWENEFHGIALQPGCQSSGLENVLQMAAACSSFPVFACCVFFLRAIQGEPHGWHLPWTVVTAVGEWESEGLLEGFVCLYSSLWIELCK